MLMLVVLLAIGTFVQTARSTRRRSHWVVWALVAIGVVWFVVRPCPDLADRDLHDHQPAADHPARRHHPQGPRHPADPDQRRGLRAGPHRPAARLRDAGDQRRQHARPGRAAGHPAGRGDPAQAQRPAARAATRTTTVTTKVSDSLGRPAGGPGGPRAAHPRRAARSSPPPSWPRRPASTWSRPAGCGVRSASPSTAAPRRSPGATPRRCPRWSGSSTRGLIDFDLAVHLTRAVGQTMARLSDWEVSALLTRVLELARQETGDERPAGDRAPDDRGVLRAVRGAARLRLAAPPGRCGGPDGGAGRPRGGRAHRPGSRSASRTSSSSPRCPTSSPRSASATWSSCSRPAAPTSSPPRAAG